MEELEKLYKVLSENKYYTKSYEEFLVQYEEPSYRKKVYDLVSSKKLYTKDFNSFETKYSKQVKKKEEKEEPTRYSEGVLGDFLGGVLDRGIAQGRSVDEGIDLLMSGSSASESEIQEYYESVVNAQSYQPSEGMIKFQKEYKEGGGDFAAFGSALLNNLSVAPEVLLESMVSMGVGASENMAIVAAGAGAGAAAGAVGGLGVGAVPGSFLGGFAVAGGALEATATLTELIQEELSDKQMDFNPENIRKILSDEEAFKKIRNKSLARGGIIGTIDLITGGIAGKATSAIAKTGKVLSKTAGAATGLAIEGVGGSLGEATARAAIGQEMDAAEIGLEGVAGISTAPISVGIPLISSPKYTVNNKRVSRSDAYDIVETMTDDQIASSDFSMEVKNDEFLANKVDEKRKKAKIKIENSNIITDEADLSLVTEKQYELDKLKNPKTRSQKKKAEQLQFEIDEITDKYIKKQPEQPVSEQEVVDAETDLTQETQTPQQAEVTQEPESIQEEVVEQEEVSEQPQEPLKTSSTKDLRDLYDALSKNDLYTKTFDEFLSQYKATEKPFMAKTKKGKQSSLKVNFDSEGKIESVVNVKTGKQASAGSIREVEKQFLKSVFDVNEGKKAPQPQGLSEREIPRYIARESENVKEIAEAIDFEKSQIAENQAMTQNMFDENNLANLKGFKFTSESWKRMTGKTPKESKIDKLWIDDSIDERTGKPNAGSIEDGWTSLLAREGELPSDVGSRVDVQDIIEFVQENNTESKLNKFIGLSKRIQKTPELIELESKFTDLTGLQPTPSNVEAVLSVDPERPPIEVLEQADRERLLSLKDAPIEDQPGTFGKKRGPSAKKLLGEEITTITVDEAKALRDQIRLEVDAAKDAKSDQTTRRRSLAQAISNLVKEGSIKTKEAVRLVNQISKVDLNKPLNVQRVLSYVERVFDDADYSKKLNEAQSLRKSIKKIAKNPKVEANLSASANLFFDVDPSLVDDINLYLEQARKVKEGITPSSAKKLRPTLDISSANEYSNSKIKQQEQIKIDSEKEAFQELTGLSADEFSLEDMREIVYGFSETQTEAQREEDLKSKSETKKEEIRKAVDKAFKTAVAISSELISSKVDPFTGEEIALSKSQRDIAKEFININVNNLSVSDAVVALDALMNFATNKTTGGMGAIVNKYNGLLNTEKAIKQNIKAKKLSVIVKGSETAQLLSRQWNRYISSLPLMIQTMFKGQSSARQFEKLSGFDDVKTGSSKAIKYANDVADAYSKTFKDKKANGDVFNSSFNDAERGMLAFVRRSVAGEESIEFGRRKSLIEQTISELSKRGGKEVELSKIYADVYNKILANSNSISDVEASADKTNLSAVNWMSNIWEKNYQDLSDINENIYNKKLSKDINYTPDSYSLLKKGEEIGQIGDPVFDFARKKISDKKTGVLMEAQRPSKLPKDRFVNLSFDSQNISNIERARMDIETAAPIQKLKGFFESQNFEKIVPDAEDRDLLKNRVIKFVQAKKGRDYISPDAQKLLKRINSYSSFGVSRTLGGLTQPIKQVVPVWFNTMVNIGPDTFKDTFFVIAKLAIDEDMANFVKNSGYAIANRGLESISGVESYNKKLENASKTNLGKVSKVINNIQDLWLQKFLVNPDRYIAQVSWLMYYMKDAKSKGVDISNIDWSTLELDKDSASFAQQQVDRQQNVSDADLQGEIFTSKNPGVQVARKIVLPFANFLLNQKARMYSDITVAVSKTSNAEDKKSAYKSLTGLVAEAAMFNLIGVYVSGIISGLSSQSKDSEEDKEKRKGQRIKGRAGNFLTDIVSPLPLDLIDSAVLDGANAFIRLVSESEDPYQFFKAQDKSAWERMGLLGIPKEKFDSWYEMGEMALGGTYEKELPFGRKKTVRLTEEGKDSMLGNWFAYTLFLTGALPSEAGTLISYNIKDIKKHEVEGKVKTR